MSDCILLKVGGSVITRKDAGCTVDGERLSSIASAISAAGAPQLLLVHGAGSCGHPEARRYRIDAGVPAGETEGIFVTHQAVGRLNAAVVDALREHGIPAAGVHPFDAAVADRGRILSMECRHLATMLSLGMVPVIHGDVVMDISRGACIVSGDQLVRYLAVALGIRRVGLATDVPGVLDGGRVVPLISRKTARTLPIGGSKHTDVTGGMRGKIDELLLLAEEGIGSEVFHISRIGDFLAGKGHGGTVITGE